MLKLKKTLFNNNFPRCDDSNMIMGVERKWAPTMMKLEEEEKSSANSAQVILNVAVGRAGGAVTQGKNKKISLG